MTGTDLNLTRQVTGTLPVANGGTGLSSPGPSTYVLTSNGSGWISSVVSVSWSNVSGKPTIPDQLTDLDTTVTGSQLDADHSKLSGIEAGADVTPTLATVATSGNYSDLSGKPAIPSSYSDLSGGVPGSDLSYGTSANTACEGNDPRVVNAIQDQGGSSGLWMGPSSSLPTAGVSGVLYVETS